MMCLSLRTLGIAAALMLGALSPALADIGNGDLPNLTPADSFLGFDGAPSSKPTVVYKAVLDGGQTVPPSPSEATGVAYMAYYKKTSQVCYQLTYTELEGNEVDAHLHAGAAGARAVPFLFNMPPFPSRVKQGCVDISVQGKKIEKQIVKLMNRGQTYINVHSDFEQGGIEFGMTGEIRGQVIPIKGLK